MLELFKKVFVCLSVIPYSTCDLVQSLLVLLHVLSDLLIGLTYYSISIMLVYWVYKRRDLPLPEIFLVLGAFIIACGTTHLMEMWTLWHPHYWFSGGIKLITAVISLYTAVAVFTLIPKALALPSPALITATHQNLAAKNYVSQTAVRHRKQAEASHPQSETCFRLIFEKAAIGIALTDVTGQLVATNSALQKMLGYSQNQLLGRHFQEFTHPEFINIEETLFQEMVEGTRDFYQLEKLYIHKEGQLIWVHLIVSLVRDAEGEPQFCIAMVENIMERKQSEVALRVYQEHVEELVVARTAELTETNKQLSWQATHDPLTGLFNRREFERCLEKAVNTARTCQQEHTLCYLDLDRFKIINDTCGHRAGDELLRQITRLLQNQCRKSDTLGRLGGDEFGLLLYQCSIEEAQRVVHSLHKCIQEFRFVWQNKTFTLGISIGVVAIGSDSLTPEYILDAADTACYAAKNQGRNQVQVYQLKD